MSANFSEAQAWEKFARESQEIARYHARKPDMPTVGEVASAGKIKKTLAKK